MTFESPILVVSPHSDDEVFGCGGFLSRFRPAAHFLLVSASDIVHRDGSVSTVKDRESEFAVAASAVGATFSFAGLQDTKLPLMKDRIIMAVEDCIDTLKPKTLMFPDRSFHQDHVAVYESCFAACRPGRAPSVRSVVTFEVPNYVWFDRVTFFEPNFYLELSQSDLDGKLSLVGLYQTQVGREVSPIDKKVVTNHAMYRGHEAGVPYAEAFRIHRKIARIGE